MKFQSISVITYVFDFEFLRYFMVSKPFRFLYYFFLLMDISAVDGNRVNEDNKPIDREKVHHFYRPESTI